MLKFVKFKKSNSSLKQNVQVYPYIAYAILITKYFEKGKFLEMVLIFKKIKEKTFEVKIS